MLHSRRGMPAEAIDQYREVLRLKRDDVEARNSLTALFVKQHRYDDLFFLLKEGAELFPKEPSSHYKLGVIYDFRKEYDSAIAEYQQAIALKSDFAKALNALGKTYMKMGNLDEAKGALEAAKKADPDLTEPRELLTSFNDETAPDSPKHIKKKHYRLSHPNHKLSHPKKRSKVVTSVKTKKKKRS
jgi:tetratricopeptide (TPR) repeat protein